MTMSNRSVRLPHPLRAPLPAIVARCVGCGCQREFDPVAVRDIQAKDRRFAVLYRCRSCKNLSRVKMFKKYNTKDGRLALAPSVGFGWL